MKQKFSKILCLILSVMMLMSVLPLSVSAACSHSYTKVYTAENGEMHSYVSKCTKCGTITEGWGYSGWLDHAFNSNGKCTDCGFCKHSNTKKVYTYENGNMHSYNSYCYGCGQTIEGWGYSDWEDHSFSGNTCTKCNYSKACAHTSTTTKYSYVSDAKHNVVIHCNSCGMDNNMGASNHSWSYGSWSATSDTQHQRSKTCVCGASSSESGSHSFSGNSCSSCGYTKVNTPAVQADVSLSASGPSGSLGSAGGEISAETYPASYTVYASATGCSVTKIVYSLNGRTYTQNGSSVTITANSRNDFYTSTFTAYTDVSGVTATFTVNFKYVSKNTAYYMWETFHEATIRSITGNGLNKTLAYTMVLDNSYDYQANLSDEQIATLQSLIGRNDGKTYTINYTRMIRVYTPADQTYSGEKIIYGTFDGNNPSEIEDCLSRWAWGSDTKSAIRQAASSSLTFTTGLPIDCTAIWIDSSTGKQLYTKTFGNGTIHPSQSKVVSVSYSEYSGSSNYVYEKLTYSGDTSGTSTSQSYSQTYTSSSKPLTVTFYCHPKEAEVTKGTITVYVRDAETNALLSGASVSGAGKSGTTGSAGYVKFASIALGTYTFTASKTGYNSGTGKGTITATASSTSVTIYLTKETPIEEEDDDYPTTGSVTVYVRDANTYALLTSAYVSGGGYGGYTNSYGYVSYSGLDYGSYSFSASKSGYYGNSGTVTISNSNTSPSITIYLTPIEEEEEDDTVYGSITVYVYDADTGSTISGASVSGAGTTKSTNYYGYTSYSDLDVGSYYFTASKSGYSSGSGSTTITASNTSRTVYIYLTPEVVTPTSGSITVYVKDANTGASISGATVSGGGYSGTTNSSGYKSFSGLSFGSYTFIASKSGYSSNSGSVSISTSTTSNSVTIYLTPTPTTGSITVYVKDADTGAYISGATISGDGSGTTNSSGYKTFSGLSFGSYSFSASKSGYYSGSGSASISTSTTSNSVTIYLTPIPTTGSITVYVRDIETGAYISGASISGDGSGTTNSSGYKVFSDMPFGTYSFSASKSGYYTNSNSVTISSSSTSKSVTIYLAPIPTSGTITVYVKDASTGAAISGASVSGGGVSGSTNTSGYVSFSNLSFGSYTFSASKSGYSSGSGSASISTSATTNSVTIYLTKLPTSGSITVTVRDKDTNAVLSGATVSGGGYSGTTGSSGTVSFSTMPFTTYTFTASKSGYNSSTGSATISATSATKSITIYLEKKKADVGVVAETVDGTVYRGSTIMVSADIYGDAAIDFTPSNPLTVTMKATRNGGTIFDTQTKSVICPKGDTNLVWFTVDIPETGYTSANVTFIFTVTTPATITDTASTNDVSSKTVTTYVLPDRSTPDASFELDPPADFTDTPFKTNRGKEHSWTVWEWNGGFVEKTYSAKLTVKTELTPDATAVWSKYNNARKLWTTRSGYGLNTAVTVSLTGVDNDMFAGNAKVNAYYPEFNYSTAAGKSNMLLMGSENESGYSASFTFDSNTDTISGNKMHVTPVWFPDGEYSVKYVVYDIWTPAGMLTTTTYAIINIEGSMYDDYYTQRN